MLELTKVDQIVNRVASAILKEPADVGRFISVTTSDSQGDEAKKSRLRATTLSPDLLLPRDITQSMLTRQTSLCGSAPSGREAMPTVLRVDGFRFYFYSHEPNEPPHVHVDRGGASAKLWLDKVTFASNAGFSAKELGDLLRLTLAHQAELLEAWHGFFGTD